MIHPRINGAFIISPKHHGYLSELLFDRNY